MNQRRTKTRSRSLYRYTSLAIWVFGSIYWGVTNVRAEPHLAIQEGYKCSKCHVNMTGGGKRTDFANIYVQTRLAHKFFDWRSMVTTPGEDADKDAQAKTDSQSSFFTGRLNDYVAIGGDFRAAWESNNVPGSTATSTFNQDKQNIYLEVNLIPGRVLFYQTFSGGGDAREIFALLKGQFKEEPYYLKVGQFFLPYGLRLLDDTAFTRAVTGFTYGASDVGLEFGFEPGPWALHLAATNGTGSSLETNRNKRLTASAAYVNKYFRLGGSYSTNKNDQGVETVIYGVNGGAQFGRLGILAEVDEIDDETNEQRVSIVELNFLITRGQNIKLSYEYHDPSTDVFENALERYSLVYEPFLNQFTQVRVGARDNDGIPQNPTSNATFYFVELHLFF